MSAIIMFSTTKAVTTMPLTKKGTASHARRRLRLRAPPLSSETMQSSHNPASRSPVDARNRTANATAGEQKLASSRSPKAPWATPPPPRIPQHGPSPTMTNTPIAVRQLRQRMPEGTPSAHAAAANPQRGDRSSRSSLRKRRAEQQEVDVADGARSVDQCATCVDRGLEQAPLTRRKSRFQPSTQ